mgnify:CR=1 FL=1
MLELPVDPVILILGIVTLISTFLYLREYNKRIKLQSQGEKILEEFKEKGLQNLHESIKKSQDILGEAELEGVKVVSESKFETSKMEDEYSKKLSEIISSSKEYIMASQTQFIQFMTDLQKRSEEFAEAGRESIEQRINRTFNNLEERLSSFLVSTEQKTTQSIELEVKAARNLIEAYKQQQLKLIDENIIAMMEQTLNIVLAKKLSLKDQVELVYEALERAKIEKFVV